MGNLSIKVSVLGGTNLEGAIMEAIPLSGRVGTPIEINFNGCSLLIHFYDEVSSKVKEYEQWLEETVKAGQMERELGFITFYLIDLKRDNGKLFWRWTRTDEWKEVTDIHSFLTTYYPPDWRSFILKTMGIEE